MIHTFSTFYTWLPFKPHREYYIKNIDPLPWILSTWNGQTIQEIGSYARKMATPLGRATHMTLPFWLDSKLSLTLHYPTQNIRFWILELDQREFYIMDTIKINETSFFTIIYLMIASWGLAQVWVTKFYLFSIS